MPTNLKIAEKSFRFGCGRYVQGNGVLAEIAAEVIRLGGDSAFIIGTKTALSLTRKILEESLEKAGIPYHIYTYTGFCCKETCAEISELDAFKTSGVVIGVGGGNVCDAAKYTAVLTGKPIINIPTSSATCAAFTPLSVFYTKEGKTVGSIHHATEVNCVLADMEILSRQPVRLALSGVYDSIAKNYELKQRMLGVDPAEIEIGLDSSYCLSRYLCDYLEKNTEAFVRDLSEGKNTKLVNDVVYMTIALTGVVSGFARGSNQTAIAHKLYEALRKNFPAEVYPHLHGEMVGLSLIAQIAFNGEGGEDAFRNTMKRYGMKTCIRELGVEPTEENFKKLYDTVVASSAMAGTNEEERARFAGALAGIF